MKCGDKRDQRRKAIEGEEFFEGCGIITEIIGTKHFLLLGGKRHGPLPTNACPRAVFVT